MMIEELSSPQEQSTRQITKAMMGSLKTEGSELGIMSLKDGEAVATTVETAMKSCKTKASR